MDRTANKLIISATVNTIKKNNFECGSVDIKKYPLQDLLIILSLLIAIYIFFVYGNWNQRPNIGLASPCVLSV